MKNIAVFLMLLVSIPAVSISAEVSLTKDKYGVTVIFIDGEIKKGDVKKVEPLASKLVKSGNLVRISINSPGGDLLEAISIGRFIKKIHAYTIIGDMHKNNLKEGRTRCYSACFVIFVSGSTRVYMNDETFGDIFDVVASSSILGIHRPYFDKKSYSNLTLKQARIEHENINKAARVYLERVSVPTKIIDEMFLYSSNEIRFIGLTEFNKEIGKKQPFFEEWLLARCGALSDQEMDDFIKVVSGRVTMDNDSYIPDGMSSGYLEYIDKKLTKITNCSNETLLDYQKGMFKE